ncbi:uracil-DNA glycosylase family 4 [Friedmanniella endophytica]|uniref:Type-5 uracil-DNA glycosylase n=1 Tax=Microlunatus kandeliicorticis TaxID=1759536 RepID=A0A7W3P7D8_9ACTN|nr:uracil-DNA glycosylase [Microlunatus kandeliicorticis]MBA8796021.1 uracil-DNA glycosylase family 4 [Microlunatus kandeliicorticis]
MSDRRVAEGPEDVARLAGSAPDASALEAGIVGCRACPRLVAWREEVAASKRRAYADQTYWGRPVPGFGVEHPAIMIVGLAPSAHGANRTGRNFTGDRSGDVLFAALHRTGLAKLPISVSRDDGNQLLHTRMSAAVRCAPPDNKPTAAERDTCLPWLVRDLELAWPSLRAVVVLGGFGWQALWPAIAGLVPLPTPLPRFGHGTVVDLDERRRVFGCFHVSPQNVNTGRLTPSMLDEVLTTARTWAGLGPPAG